MRFTHRIPALLLAVMLLFSPAAVREAAAGESNCTEQWEECIAQATIDANGDYRGEGDPGTIGEDIECAFEYAGCTIRKLKFW
jgi:hypothetical protein